VVAADATSLIRIVLQGSAMPATVSAPSALTMPALGWRLTDNEVADVLSLIRNSWGNQAVAVTATEVVKVRAAVRLQTAVERCTRHSGTICAQDVPQPGHNTSGSGR
jgi:hypothetical protein